MRYAVSIAVLIGTVAAGNALAGNAASITIHYQVSPIAALTVDDESVSLRVDGSAAGDETKTSSASTTYRLTSNDAGRAITGSLDGELPQGLALSATLTPPDGAVGSGEVVLGTVETELVTGIPPTVQKDLGITLRLFADISAGTIESEQTLLTLTITNR